MQNTKTEKKRSRRPNGSGMLRKRPNGMWEFRIMVGYKENGWPLCKSLYARTQRQVIEKANALKLAQQNGINLAVDYTFGEWAEVWLLSRPKELSPATKNGYIYTLRILNRFFENQKLRSINTLAVEQMLQTLQADGYSSSVISKARSMMNHIIDRAVANNLILSNPVQKAEKMSNMNSPQEKDAFTATEIEQLMRELPFNKVGISMRLMLGSGMRTQELLALEPRHISEDGSMIAVRQAVKMNKGSIIVGQPKSRHSIRDIPVPESLRWCAITLRNTPDKFIWESPKITGQPVNPSYFRVCFREALETVPGVRRLSPHATRHSYISQLHALGVDLATIQRLVGHSDLSSIQNTYLHVQMEPKLQAAELFSKAFSMNTTIDVA